MANVVTARDWDIFRALARCPLTVRQIEKVSETFSAPFRSERRLQRRLHALTAAGLIRQWRYATSGPGVPCYYTLSPESYRLLHGHDAILPGHRAFEALSSSRQQHTQSLADFIVHTTVAAHRADCTIAEFHREGSLRLQVGPDFLYPDCTFRLITPDSRTFDFFTELDNGTETVQTQDGRGSFEQKIASMKRTRISAKPSRKTTASAFFSSPPAPVSGSGICSLARRSCSVSSTARSSTAPLWTSISIMARRR